MGKRRATVMGLGHFGGGTAAARWLALQGYHVTVTDLADENTLADPLVTLADVPIAAFHLGGHCEEDFRNADLVVVNPAVRPDSPWLHVARQSAARLCTELELFVENCPAPIVGVTGSNGKSTTAAMTAAILAAAGRRVFLGGNIGGSLLSQLPQIGSDAWIVLEISSFQLWHFSPAAKMPQIAVVTGCTPNHLDWHAIFSDYVAAKQRILTGQTPKNIAVLNISGAEVAAWMPLVKGQLMKVGGNLQLDDLPHLSVSGEHNRLNAVCATAAATAAGCNPEAIRRGLEQFRGLPQRLEWIATVEGRRFYNDSASTTPESTIAAMQSLEMPIWLIAGGKQKGADFQPLAAEIIRRASGAAMFGSARNDLYKRITRQNPQFRVVTVETMEESLQWCFRHSHPDEAILLSPACASTDQFRNFQQRGQRFVELVRRIAS